MKKERSTEKRHLAIALICSAALVYFIVQAFNQPLAQISFHANDIWGSGYSATGLFFPIVMLAFAAYFSWRGYFEDRQIRLLAATRKTQSETLLCDDRQHSIKPNKVAQTDGDKLSN